MSPILKIVIIVVIVSIILIIVFRKKDERFSSVMKSNQAWTEQQKDMIKSKLDRIILCPDEDKDSKISNCVLKKLCKYDFNQVVKEFEIGENSDLIQDIMASCFANSKCKLPEWIDEDKKKAFNVIVSSDMMDKSCQNPEIIAKRAMCQLQLTHKMLSYQDMFLYHQHGVAPRPKIAEKLNIIKGQCYTSIPCSE
jgi:hypothetical protein